MKNGLGQFYNGRISCMSEPKKRSAFKVLQSTLAGLFGIQSEKNRQEDFSSGSATNYIIAGVIGVVLLLIGMNIFVKTIITASGS